MNEIYYTKYLKYKNKYLNTFHCDENIIYINGGGICTIDSTHKYFKFNLRLNDCVYLCEILLNNSYDEFTIKENGNIKYQFILDVQINIYIGINIAFLLLQKEYMDINIIIMQRNKKIYNMTLDEKKNVDTINFTFINSFLEFYKNVFNCNIDKLLTNFIYGDKINDILSYILKNTTINTNVSHPIKPIYFSIKKIITPNSTSKSVAKQPSEPKPVVASQPKPKVIASQPKPEVIEQQPEPVTIVVEPQLEPEIEKPQSEPEVVVVKPQPEPEPDIEKPQPESEVVVVKPQSEPVVVVVEPQSEPEVEHKNHR